MLSFFYYPNNTFYMSVWVAKKLHREILISAIC